MPSDACNGWFYDNTVLTAAEFDSVDKFFEVEFNDGSFPTDRSYLGESRIVHIVTDAANAVIGFKTCPMTIRDPCVSDNVSLFATVEEDYMSNHLSSTNIKVNLYTSLNMNFLDEVNFEPTTIYDLLTTNDEICTIAITEGTKDYGDEAVSAIRVFSDSKEIGFDTFPGDTDVVSYASIETNIHVGVDID